MRSSGSIQLLITLLINLILLPVARTPLNSSYSIFRKAGGVLQNFIALELALKYVSIMSSLATGTPLASSHP